MHVGGQNKRKFAHTVCTEMSTNMATMTSHANHQYRSLHCRYTPVSLCVSKCLRTRDVLELTAYINYTNPYYVNNQVPVFYTSVNIFSPVNDTFCNDRFAGFYDDPNDCQAFFQCLKGRATKRFCWLVFHASVNVT